MKTHSTFVLLNKQNVYLFIYNFSNYILALVCPKGLLSLLFLFFNFFLFPVCSFRRPSSPLDPPEPAANKNKASFFSQICTSLSDVGHAGLFLICLYGNNYLPVKIIVLFSQNSCCAHRPCQCLLTWLGHWAAAVQSICTWYHGFSQANRSQLLSELEQPIMIYMC